MEKMSEYERLSLIAAFIPAITAIAGYIFSNEAWFFWFLVLIPIIILSIFVRRYNKQKEYIRFIEFLTDNDYHCFRVLPLLRMYIHKHNLKNAVKIHKAHIKYDILPNPETKVEPDGVLLGDCEIHYVFDIENSRLPKTFHFICANDNSYGEPLVKYRFGTSGTYTAGSSRTNAVHPHWGGNMKDVSISLEDPQISNGRVITLELFVSMKKAFYFTPDGRDTIICLPTIYSSTIECIEFEIDVSNFSDNAFYCSAKKIYSKKKKSSIDNIRCIADNNIFKTTTIPDSHSENAYYFRIGLGEVDPDDKQLPNSLPFNNI